MLYIWTEIGCGYGLLGLLSIVDNMIFFQDFYSIGFKCIIRVNISRKISKFLFLKLFRVISQLTLRNYKFWFFSLADETQVLNFIVISHIHHSVTFYVDTNWSSCYLVVVFLITTCLLIHQPLSRFWIFIYLFRHRNYVFSIIIPITYFFK